MLFTNDSLGDGYEAQEHGPILVADPDYHMIDVLDVQHTQSLDHDHTIRSPVLPIDHEYRPRRPGPAPERLAYMIGIFAIVQCGRKAVCRGGDVPIGPQNLGNAAAARDSLCTLRFVSRCT
jgi:hypothetical protein